ncbi:hydrolase [Natronococcus sp. A-GB1]|uniref:hydrolase n=1 Tax=Natronococcus sp. A-GB1 TaxID=3037648 RepID=UPI00241F2111|nr:hydrolase [Natronococcus sp. A-GB1]MDG5760143.1 hydrolase [Natronococcus sp. A-GB1]
MLHLTFPTHLAMGYLLGVYSRFPVAYLVVGSALPDLVDRPLYWLGLTPFTHTVAHSIAVAVPASLVLTRLFGRRGAALSLGWLLHIGTDFLNVATTQGLSTTPYYVFFLGPPSDEREAFETVTIVLPVTDVTHTLHPVVLALEVAVLGWAVLAILQEWGLPGRVRGPESD